MRYMIIILLLSLCFSCSNDTANAPIAGKDLNFTPDLLCVADGELYYVNILEQQQYKITDSGYEKRLPAWKPDGSGISYVIDDLYFIPVDGNEAVKLTHFNDFIYNYKWSPDGSRIALTLYKDFFKYDLYIIDADGSNLRKIEENRNIEVMEWIADGRGIIYSIYEDQTAQVYKYLNVMPARLRMSSENIKPQHIFESTYKTCIVVSSTKGIHHINLDGSGVDDVLHFNLTNGNEMKFSPDGSKLAFIETVGQYNEIHIMNPLGSGARNISLSDTRNQFYSWSSDGSKLLIKGENAKSEPILYIAEADGSSAFEVITGWEVSEAQFHPDYH